MSSPTAPMVLTAIVKNEAKIMTRFLTEAARYCTHFAIVDTGSTDATIETIHTVTRRLGIPEDRVRVAQRPWTGFGPAKTAALCLAHEAFPDVPYALVLDADEFLEGDLTETLTHDRYNVNVAAYGPHFRTATTRVFRLGADIEWRYLGVLHEIPWSERSFTEGTLSLSLHSPRDGARSENPTKYADDAALLERSIAELKAEIAGAKRAGEAGTEGSGRDDPRSDASGIPANLRDGFLTRYRFYLGQSYRDAGNHAAAATAYRARMGEGPGLNYEEIYVSGLEAGRALQRLGRHHESQRAWLDAHQSLPHRTEALRHLADIFTEARAIQEIALAQGQLFVEWSESQREVMDSIRAAAAVTPPLPSVSEDTGVVAHDD